MPKQEVLEKLDVKAELGLHTDEAKARQLSFGPNELIERGLKSPWAILWEQLTAVMVVVLIIAAVISALLGDWLDAWVILAIVVINAILGFHPGISRRTGHGSFEENGRANGQSTPRWRTATD